MRRIKGLALAVAVIGTLLIVPGAASGSGWHYTFHKNFGVFGADAQASKLKATKCHGGPLGNWNLDAKHFILINDEQSGIFVQLDMRVKLPITTQFKHLKVKKFELDYSDNYPEIAADEIHDSLVPFYNTSKAKVNADVTKMTFAQSGLEIGGTEVIEPDKTTVPFKPKPGC